MTSGVLVALFMSEAEHAELVNLAKDAGITLPLATRTRDEESSPMVTILLAGNVLKPLAGAAEQSGSHERAGSHRALVRRLFVRLIAAQLALAHTPDGGEAHA
jgi:uncharacterized protein (UPF0264 family)